MPQPVDRILLPQWLLPLNGRDSVLENHALVIQDGRILDLCPEDEARSRYESAHWDTLPNQVLMPGLINAHGHAAMSLFRGLADDLPLMTWLNDHIWPAEGRWVSEDFVADGVRLAVAEMIRAGITTFSDMYFFPEVTAQVASAAGIRTQVAFPVMDFPTAWGSGPDEYLRKGLALIDEYRHSQLVSVAFGPHAPYTVSDEPFEKIITLANQVDRPIQVHLHETASEVEQALANTGQRPLARLQALGLLGPQTQCVHMTQLDGRDMDTLAASGAHVVHCPQSNLKLASGFCPVAELQNRGVNVAIGTDGAASNNDLDLLDELKTAALLAKAVAQDASALPAAAALEMATLNGARALGLESLTGSLEAGKQADCIAVSLDELNSQPLYNLASQLVYATGAHQVRSVWVAGKCLLEDGQLTTLDLPSIRHNTQAWQARISAA